MSQHPSPAPLSLAQIETAQRLFDAVHSEVWTKVLLPFLSEERDVQIEAMASMTDPLQLMRYAGSIQTLKSLMDLEKRSKAVLDQAMQNKSEKFQ